MAYDTQTFRIYRGEDAAPVFTPDTPPAGPVTGWTLLFIAWNKLDGTSTSPEVSKTSGAGVAVADSAAKTFAVALDSADTKDLDAGYYGWELWRTDAGSRKVLAAGTMELAGAKKDF